MSLVQAVANSVLNEIFGGTNYTAPATLYAAASTTTPAADGTNVTEPTGNAYARVAVTNNTTNFPSASSGAKHNGADITWPEATGSWGTITNIMFYDAITGGNPIVPATLTAAKTIGTGDTLRIAANGLTLNL